MSSLAAWCSLVPGTRHNMNFANCSSYGLFSNKNEAQMHASWQLAQWLKLNNFLDTTIHFREVGLQSHSPGMWRLICSPVLSVAFWFSLVPALSIMWPQGSNLHDQSVLGKVSTWHRLTLRISVLNGQGHNIPTTYREQAPWRSHRHLGYGACGRRCLEHIRE